jgi:hypothetical protein
MPPQNELPEGTDHVVNGAMNLSTEGNGSGGSSAAAGSGGAAGGLIAAGMADDTGGTASGGGDSGGSVVDQLKSQATQLRDQGTDRVREFATSGKTRASDALEELSRVFIDTAETIDERLGNNYGEYARKASDAVSSFADTLRRREVDEIYDDMRDAVKKSPGVALGVAAVVGFALARVVKAGLAPDQGTSADGGGGTIGSGTRSGGSGTGAGGSTGA